MKCKIAATVGPASLHRIEELIDAGVTLFRVNAAHGTPETNRATILKIREVADRLGATISIMLDLAGPKIRVGPLKREPRRLKSGSRVTLVAGHVCHPREIPILYPELCENVRPGHRILLADGTIALTVEDIRPPHVIARVVHGGYLMSRKGVNLPDMPATLPALTEKDRKDLAAGLDVGIDIVSLSFVRTSQDVLALHKLLHDARAQIPVIAKLEKPQALQHLDAILAVADGVMVARGDLGVELPYDEIALHQKSILRKAMRFAKPAITATQMLISMVANPYPTRAEVTDVTNAVLDGTDVLLLSDETARGRYPVEAVRVLRRVIEQAEAYFERHRELEPFREPVIHGSSQHAICYAAYSLAHRENVQAILVPTWSGSTARIIASYRPRQPIIAFTPLERTWRLLSLVRGVRSFRIPPVGDPTELLALLKKITLEQAGLGPGDKVVITAGLPLKKQGHTNLIYLDTLSP